MRKSFGLDRAGLALGVALLIGGVFAQGAVAQEGNGLVTDFTTEGGTPLVTKGEYLLRGTTLVQYQGKAAEVIIPADLGITEIGDGVFYHSGIRSVAIPEGVKKLGVQSFRNCYYLETITLPRSLAEIGREAFYRCSRLSSIDLPASLTTIGNYAFDWCSSLKSITVSAPKPPVLTGSLWSAPPAVIYVPAAALDAYKNGAGWKTHADRIQAAGN
jgi:hypothetical protein